MADVTYLLQIRNPAGALVAEVARVLDADAGRSINTPAAVRIRLAPDQVPDTVLVPDARLRLLRTGTDGVARTALGSDFLLRSWRQGYAGNEEFLELAGQGVAQILARRIVAYAAGSAQAEKAAAAASNIMRALVRENLGSSAAADRDLSSWLQVQADDGIGASVAKSVAWRPLDGALADVAEASALAGTRLYWHIAWLENDGKYEYQVKQGQPGADKTSSVQLDSAAGDVQNAVLIRDYSEQLTHVYIGGQGIGAARTVVEVDAPERLGSSPFGRVEGWADRRQYTSSTGMADEGRAELWDKRARILFSGTVNAGAWEYSRYWDFGDLVRVLHAGQMLTCMINSVRIHLADGAETITADLREV